MDDAKLEVQSRPSHRHERERMILVPKPVVRPIIGYPISKARRGGAFSSLFYLAQSHFRAAYLTVGSMNSVSFRIAMKGR